MSLLGRDEACDFLKKLGLSSDEIHLKEDPLTFVTQLVRAFMEHLPFQCVSIMAQEQDELHVPTLEEVVAAGLSLEGGVCFTLNTFMCILLQTLGFDANVLDGCYSGFGNTHDHVIILLKNLRFADDDYIIDVGCGFPFAAPVPLADLPSTTYHAGLEYKYEREGDNVLRLHRAGDTPLDKETPVMRDQWRQVFHFNLTPVDFDFFIPQMKKIYTQPTACDFHANLRGVRFISQDLLHQMTHGCTDSSMAESGDDDKVVGCHFQGGNRKDDDNSMGSSKIVMLSIKNQRLLTGPLDDAQKTEIEMENLADKIKQFFPTIPSKKVDLAVLKLQNIKKFS